LLCIAALPDDTIGKAAPLWVCQLGVYGGRVDARVAELLLGPWPLIMIGLKNSAAHPSGAWT